MTVAGGGTGGSIPVMRIGARLLALVCLSPVLLPVLSPVGAGAGLWAQDVAPVTGIDPQVTALAGERAKFVYLRGDFRWFTSQIDGEGTPKERQGDFAVVRGKPGQPAMYNVFTSDLERGDVHRWCSDGIDRWAIEQAIEGEPPTIRQFKPGVADVDRDRVVACVLLDVPALSKEFSIVRTGERLVFIPRDPALAGDLSSMTVVLAAGVPTEVIIDDTHNTRIKLVIKKLEQLEAVPKDLNELLFRPVTKELEEKVKR